MSDPQASSGPPTSAVLMSTAKHIAVRCGKANKAYLDCKKSDRDPAACLSQGDGVTRCVIDMSAPLSSTHAADHLCVSDRVLRDHAAAG